MLRKITNIRVPSGAGSRKIDTKSVFATYDKQSAAFAFYFSDSNIARATANLLFMVDGQKVFVDDGVTLSETNETHTFTYPLPDKLLNYTGKVDGYLYFDFEDGSHSDEIHFVFTIKKSQIDKTMEEAPDVYIKSFEDVKAEVQEAADGAKETISQKVTEVFDTSDSAISKVNQVADDATESITTAADSIDKAKSNAEATISEHVSSVGSAKEAAERRIDEAVESTESARDDAVKSMNELDYSDRNLLTGTSSKWKEYSFDSWTAGYFTYTPEQLGLSIGDTLTYSVKYDNAKDTNNDASVSALVNFYRDGNKLIGQITGNKILSGEVGLSYGTINIPEGTTKIQAYGAGKSEGDNKKLVSAKEHKLQFGTRATPWTPAPEDIALKSEIEQIKQAIINLGGSV